MSTVTTLHIDPKAFPDAMNLRLASVYVDTSEQRLRTLAREGSLEGATKDEAGVWTFSKAGLDKYVAGKGTRKPGTRKASVAGKAFVIHVTAEKLDGVKNALGALGIQLEQRYDYAKQADYRKRRNAAIKASKAAAKA